MQHQQNNLHGILWMSSMAVCAAIMGVAIRLLREGGINAFEIVFFYNFFALTCFIPNILRKKVKIRTKHMKFFCLRSVLEFIGWSLSFFAISLIPLPIYTSLSYMTSLLLYTVAVIILREHASIHRWIAFITGFIGVMIIIHPGFGEENINGSRDDLYLAAFMMFCASCCFASCGVIIKKVIATEMPGTVTFYMALLTCIVSIPTAIYFWQTPTPAQWLLAAMVGILSFGQQFSVTKAFSKADLTTILPISLTTLVYSSILAYIFFDELVDIWTIGGAVIIISSVLYATYHANVKEVGIND